MNVDDVLQGQNRWAVIHGKAETVLSSLPTSSVSAIVTDPPYGTGAWLRADEGQGSDPRATHRVETWDCWSTDWLDEAWRVSHGCVGLFLAAREIGSLLHWVGGRPWRMFVWCKSDPRPRFGGQPAYGFDPFIVIGRVQPVGGKDYILASSPRRNRDGQAAGHPHQKRISVMSWCLSLTSVPGDSILDPFAGSGSTGVACMQNGRSFVGVEQDAAWCEMARARIGEAWGPLFKTNQVSNGSSDDHDN